MVVSASADAVATVVDQGEADTENGNVDLLKLGER